MHALIHLDTTILIEGKHIVRLEIGTLHTGRADRHARHCEPQDIRSFLEQTRNHVARHVPFDHIVFDDTRMARTQTLRDTVVF